MKDHTLDDSVREEIISAAAEVFENYGLAKVTMRDISSATKRGRSSLYYYFKNKNEVFDALAEKMMRDIFEACAGNLSIEASLPENIEKFQLHKLRTLRGMVLRFHLVFRDLRQDPTFLFGKMRVLLDEEFALIEKTLKWAMDKGEIKPLSPADSRFLAETMVIALRSFEQEIVLFDRFPDFEEKLAWVVAIFCKGLK